MRCCTCFCTTLEQPPLRSPKNIHPTDIPKEPIRKTSPSVFLATKKFKKKRPTNPGAANRCLLKLIEMIQRFHGLLILVSKKVEDFQVIQLP